MSWDPALNFCKYCTEFAMLFAQLSVDPRNYVLPNSYLLKLESSNMKHGICLPSYSLLFFRPPFVAIEFFVDHEPFICLLSDFNGIILELR